MANIRNNKGMTLVEIIITLMIASIIMVMAGSILLSSIGFFDRHAVSDFDKSILDSSYSTISEQLEYATGVTISSTSLSGDEQYADWSYYRINAGRIYASYDGALEQDLYTDDFYHNQAITMKVQRKSPSDLYLYMAVLDDGNEVYERSQTIRLINIEVLIERKESQGIHVSNDNLYQDVYIYFLRQKEKSEEEPGEDPTPPSNITGTVADEMLCLEGNETLYKGDFTTPFQYERGDFVTYNGVYYRAVDKINANNADHTPDKQNTGWKRIDAYWNITSKYQKDDIVIYGKDQNGDDIYYISVHPGTNVGYNPSTTIGHVWDIVDKADLPEAACRVK